MLHKLSSCDRQHSAMLICVGDIRFGPPYFSLSIDDKELADRVFGKEMLWSPDSRYLVVQEWLSTAERDGPQTALLCIDVREERQCKVSQATGGFIVPVRFEDDNLIYEKRYFSAGRHGATEYEIRFTDLPRWRALRLR
ncbi:hypothetical protein F6Q07_02385 [Pectobacterium parmentieri]|uniref:Uncharacterized protein n=1 Tax=Pectobacterium parmentieri TaxID=1905730 RepID=A0A0H3I4M2_PECPM|nr:hypothetical protein [Pectobacterium parmentieri]ACX88239.1 conserved hypothetical protein [Pectobacterium parmentieri WPP163]AFI90540.1 Hypothetical protein W5S_2452 [Pectobacterium parmentieri]AYH01671.1 hypothetical protein C5E26_12385 [Pectobacterium parmentieri]AYH05933.1 hypothetical protein C5E25_11535 [Pectobacterium parmentieri]AYH14754.1 hypothetical protein C5E23_11505 [Pectobacterium parmentieri]